MVNGGPVFIEKICTNRYKATYFIQGHLRDIEVNLHENVGVGILDGADMTIVNIIGWGDKLIYRNSGYGNVIDDKVEVIKRDVEGFVKNLEREAKAWDRIVELGGDKYI